MVFTVIVVLSRLSIDVLFLYYQLLNTIDTSHPLLLFMHGSQASDSSFFFAESDTDAYFSLRDKLFSGTIKTVDGKRLNVRMMYTLLCY